MTQALIYDSPEDTQEDLTLYGDTGIPPLVQPISKYLTEQEIYEKWDQQTQLDGRRAEKLAAEHGVTIVPNPDFSWANIEPRTTFDFLMVRAKSEYFGKQLAEELFKYQLKTE
jgi:hypothetical protein